VIDERVVSEHKLSYWVAVQLLQVSSASATSSSASSSPVSKKLWTSSRWCVLLSPSSCSRWSLRVSRSHSAQSTDIPCPEKREQQYFVHNLNRFKHIVLIFTSNITAVLQN